MHFKLKKMPITKCLLCLKKNKKQFKIWSKIGIKLNLANIIAEHFWLRPSLEDRSISICSTCWNILKDFHEFYQNIAKAHKYLETKINLSDPRKELDEPFLDAEDLLEVNNLFESSQLEIVKEITNEKDATNETNAFDITENSEETPLKILEIDDSMENQSIRPLSEEVETNSQLTEEHNIPMQIKEENIGKIKNKLRKITKSKDLLLKTKTDFSATDSDSNKSNSSDYSVHLSDIEAKERKLRDKYDKNIARFFEKLPCTKCQFSCKKFDELKTHFKLSHENVMSIICCNRSFYRRSTLSDHALFHLYPDYLKCTQPKCDKIFKDRYKLEKHEEAHRKSLKAKRFQCEHCPKMFATKRNLKEHLGVHTSKSEYKYICTECGSRYATRDRLRQHKSIAHSLSCICDVCGTELKNKRTLSRHILKHTENSVELSNPVQCDICGKWLKHANSLQQHKTWVHNQRTEIHCRICNKVSPNLRALECHIARSHEMKKKFQCTICSKNLKTARELREHTNAHTKEIVYDCKICSKTFNRKASFDIHNKNFHSESPLETFRRTQCVICSAWLSSFYNLQNHIKTVHRSSNREFRCKICERVSVHEVALKRHIKRNHGLEALLSYTKSNDSKNESTDLNVKIENTVNSTTVADEKNC